MAMTNDEMANGWRPRTGAAAVILSFTG